MVQVVGRAYGGLERRAQEVRCCALPILPCARSMSANSRRTDRPQTRGKSTFSNRSQAYQALAFSRYASCLRPNSLTAVVTYL